MTRHQQIALRIDGLRMRYGTAEILTDVTFQMRHGEITALLGPNGAGKTTTIEVLEGFRQPSGGQIEVLGTDPAQGGSQWRARVGVVLQSWRDHARWRVRELLAHQGRYYTRYATDLIERPWDVDDLLEVVGLTDHADQQVRLLSGGQRRRLDVAIGVVGRPELLFLDEPTAGFDPEARREFHDLVLRLAAEGDTTVLLTTHDLNEAEKLADRILILDRGRIVADGTPSELARQIVGDDLVRWTHNGQRYVRSTTDSTSFIFQLFQQYGDAITDLEIQRSSLEDTYLHLVRQAEAGAGTTTSPELGEVA
ncbi:ABC transporter ATP-binding protein [Phytoactinopolyspora limicola]|uniref:ABC transporter ATP-binding protein n=1 Tax=Phytoactinopolyspora limicola TaxID=2715536 RepID=UPI00140CFBB5|nr:ABC transporter ATP-binding protein [Phytoactinopolyspora limicola]